VITPSTRRALLASSLVAGGLCFALVVHRHDSIGDWLFFRYLRALALATLFGSSCLVAGHAIVVRTLGRTLPLGEHFAIAFPLGVMLFFLVSFGFGLLGLYGGPFFLLAPCLLLAFGASRFWSSATRLRRHLARARPRYQLRLFDAACGAFGCLGVALIWFPILSPQNASYDARWYHLPIAEHYVAQGGIRPFSEGWVPGALPQLASLLYAWALSGPGTLFDRVETAAHLELIMFLATLASIAPMVGRVLGRRAPWSWVALLLFPGIYCYDSGLVLGADHVVALWAAPIFLLSLRYLEAPSRSVALLLGAAVAGALNTKYTALSLAVLPAVVVLTRLVSTLRAPAPGHRTHALSVLAALSLLTAPHWLKNAAFYGDPLFPALRRWLPAQPWSQAAEAPHQLWFTLHHPPPSFGALLEMLRTLVTFSFEPHDFPQYHGALPVFGSLFTLCTPPLLLLGRRRRLHWLFAGVYLGLCAWFWIHQWDRYIQALLPWMAAGTAAVLMLLWQEGPLVRAAVALVVGLQVVWGAAVPFIPAHRAAGRSIYQVVIDLLGRPFRKGDPLTSYPAWEAMARALPPNAKVLIHEEEIHFGLGVPTALDYSGHQGVFYWGEPGATTPAEVYGLLRDHGITHLVWADRLDHASDTVAAGLVFFDFAVHHSRRLGTFDGFALAELPDAAPAGRHPGDVAYYPCEAASLFAPGLYPLQALARSPGDQRSIARPRSDTPQTLAIERAEFLVYDTSCRGALPESTRERFELLAARGRAMLMQRKRDP
jgi:hypothetical protein